MGLRRILPTAVVTLVLLSVPVVALADTDDPWEFDGGGWGHGVGLSQFGALGQAQEGRSEWDILHFYYEGTEAGSMPGDHWTNDPDGLWVGLVSDTESVNLTAVGGPITVCQPAPGCGHVEQEINPGESWKFEIGEDDNAGKCRLRHVNTTNNGYADCKAAISDVSPSNRVKLDGTEYARGTIRFDPSSNGFHAVVTLDIETYLHGLAEVPSSWPSAALRAQAIIGRSFALATAAERGEDDGSGKLSTCGCHIRSTTADQAYAGWSKESGALGSRWKQAVDDTESRILTHSQSNYPFEVAKAFYSSSNGGASENNEDVWTQGSPLPWLRSVEDEWSSNPDINPLARWSVKVTDEDMAAYFGWDRVLDASKSQGPPDVLVEFTGKKDGDDVATTLNGTQIASLLKEEGFGYEPVLGGNSAIRVSPFILSVVDPPGFDDSVGHTFEVAIDWMLDENITVGCNPPDNNHYCPSDPVTRGHMAVFLSRVLGLPSPSGDHFEDDDGAFYESAANRLYEAGITVGCEDGRFCGDQRITRGQMAAFMIRALDDPPVASKDYFTDDDNSIFEDAINQIAESKITLGCNPPANDRYCPDDDVTRGQMAGFFRRAWGS